MKMAHGDYFIIMDDDAILQNNFLKILNNIVSNTKINALCPKILDPDTKESFAEFSLNTGRKNLGYFDFNYFRGGIHILNKEIVMKNGYFDERFGIGGKYQAAEESDYFFRLKQLNEDIMYFPDLIAYHPIEKNPCSSKVFSYSYAISAMLTKQIISDLPHFYYYFIIILRRLCVSLLRSLQYSFFPKSIEEKNKIYKYKYFFQGSLKGIFDYLIFR
jgi:GT2 family glycosyltransferase